MRKHTLLRLDLRIIQLIHVCFESNCVTISITLSCIVLISGHTIRFWTSRLLIVALLEGGVSLAF